METNILSSSHEEIPTLILKYTTTVFVIMCIMTIPSKPKFTCDLYLLNIRVISPRHQRFKNEEMVWSIKTDVQGVWFTSPAEE